MNYQILRDNALGQKSSLTHVAKRVVLCLEAEGRHFEHLL
jgi:hypothetical protein